MSNHSLKHRLFAFILISSIAFIGNVSAAGLLDVASRIQTLSTSSQPPVAENLEFTTYKNIAYMGELSAYDPEGEKITYQLIDKPARGNVVFSGDGSPEFVYTPYENKTGKDSFTYVAVDKGGNISDTATVKIKIQKPSTNVSYADLNDHPAHNAAIRLAEEEIFVGSFMDGSYYFQPDLPVTRAEFLVLSMSAVGMKSLEGVTSTGFHDDNVIATWAKPYISSALKSGIVQGTVSSSGEITFGSDDPISAADATFILNNLLAISDIPIETAAINTETIPAWVCQAAVNLESVGVLKSDSEGNLLLKHDLTRGDTAQMLSFALDVLESRDNSFHWFK